MPDPDDNVPSSNFNRIRSKVRDRRALTIEDLPDDLAVMLEAALDDLWNPYLVEDDGDTLIGQTSGDPR